MFYDLLGSWGFGINGVMDSDYAFSWLDIDDAGKVRFIGREDKFKNMVEFYNKLWTEGLVDKESYSQDQTQAAAKVNAGQVGFVARRAEHPVDGAAAENYVQCPVLEGPYGDRALINVESNVQMTGVAVITTANKYPEATMRWLDYFYSEEGTVLCRLGIEGESYEVVDGKYQLLDNIKNQPRRADAGPGSGPVGPSSRAATCLSISPTKWTRARPSCPKPKRPTMWYAIMWCPLRQCLA